MDRKETLRGVLAAISSAHDALPKNPPLENDSENGTGTGTSILQGLVAKEGAVLTLPALRALDNTTGSAAASFPTIVLKSALEARNPLKGKSSSTETSLKLKQPNTSDDKPASNSPKHLKNSKAEQILENIKQSMHVDLQPTSAKGHVANESFSDALKSLSSNLDSTVEYLFNTQLAFFMAKVGQKSIHEKGEIPTGLAKALAGLSLSPSNMFTEETDHKSVSDALDNWKPPKKTVTKKIASSKKFSSEEDDAKLVAQSLNGEISLASMQDYPTPSVFSKKTNPLNKEDEDEPMQDSSKSQAEDSLGHVATITSIHSGSTKESLRSMIADSRIETSKRSIRVSVVKRSAIFKLQNEEACLDDASEKNVSVMPLTFLVKVTVNVAGEDHALEFSTPGTISGKFEEEGAAQLNAIEVNLDTNIFFELIIRQVNKTIKTFISKQKPTQTKKKTKQPKRNSNASVRSNNQNVAHGQAAHYLTSLSANANQNKANEGHNGMPQGDRKRNSKRARDSMESRNSSQMESPHPRRSAITSFGGQPTEAPRMGDEDMRRASIPRFSGVSHMDMDTLFRQQPMTDLDATIEALRRGSSNGDSNNALAEAIRMAEMDAAWNQLRTRSGGNSMAAGGNSMAAAAEAVRRAEADNNLQSLSGMSQMRRNSNGNYNNGADLDAAINAALTRRTSYSNNPYSQNTQDVARMAEVEAAINGFSGRGSYSVTAEALQMAEIEAEMRRQGHRMNRNSMNDNEDAMRLAQLESVMRGHGGRNDNNNSSRKNAMNDNEDAMRLAQLESVMRGHGRRDDNNNNRNSISVAAEAVRLAEMESSMRHASRPGDSMAAAAEAVRLAEMESSMRRGSRPGDSMAEATGAVRIAEMEAERRRRSSFTEAMRLVGMDAMRRSSAGTSMAAAAEAVRLAEMDAYSNQRRQSHQGQSHPRSFNTESLEALMRRSNGPNSSMAVDAMNLAELERWSRRSSSGPGGGNPMSVAAEAARLAEMENELTRQLMGNSQGVPNDLSNMSLAMRNSSGRRVSFGPDTSLHDQLGRFQR